MYFQFCWSEIAADHIQQTFLTFRKMLKLHDKYKMNSENKNLKKKKKKKK